MPDLDRVRIRTAVPADAPLLRELDEQAPAVVRDVATTTDRGEDWFAQTRLMEAPTVIVAENEGRLVAVLSAARHTARVAGEDREMVVAHQVRVLPEFRGKGLGIMLIADLASRMPPLGGNGSFYFCMERDNEASQGFARATFNKWAVSPYRATLSTDAADPAEADAESIRAATPEDAALIAECLNAGHRDEEFFVPYTVEALTARLTRDAALYSWPDVLVGRGAAVGIGNVCCRARRERDGELIGESVVASVFDHGCEPGAEDELSRLLRAACARAAKKGVTSLLTYASHGARWAPVIDALAAERVDLDLWTPSINEPDGTATRGVYVDAVYV